MQVKEEKENFKLADYFVTVGIDDYHASDEVLHSGKKQSQEQSEASASTKGAQLPEVDVKFHDDEEDFDRVVSKLEIFAIKDQSIFSQDYEINGAKANTSPLLSAVTKNNS